jgi:hypothetical protein
MHHKFSTAHCTQVSQHKKRQQKQIQIGRAVIKRIKHLLEETPDAISENPSKELMPQEKENLVLWKD